MSSPQLLSFILWCLYITTTIQNPDVAKMVRANALDGSRWFNIGSMGEDIPPPPFENNNESSSQSQSRQTRQAPDSSDDQGSCVVQVEPPKPVKLRNDTRFNNVKHDYTFSDISSNAPSRFPDMGYLMLGYDLYKGNPLTYGFDPGFRHPLFDYGKIENYETSLDGRHTHPVGTTALPARACTATFKKTIVNTVEDFQDRQTSALSQAFGYEHKGQDPADVIPNPATPATPGPATSSPTKKDKIKNAAKKVYAAGKKALAAGKRILASATAKVGSSFNEEFNAGKHSSNREDSTSIFAEAKCTVYRAKLNFEASPPLLQEVKDWIFEMLEFVKANGQQLVPPLRKQILKFIDYYGTHIVTEADFGARYIYNFTLTAKDEAEVYDQFESFSSAVDFSLGIGPHSASYGRNKSGSEESNEFKSNFDKLVETTVSSVGAPLPSSSDEAGPDPAEWAKNVAENPVPIKLSLVSIESILDNREFVDKLKCKNYETAHVETLRDHFRLMLPRKVVTTGKGSEKHCRKIKKVGLEKKRMQELFETAQISLEFENVDKIEASNTQFLESRPLMDVLLAKFDEEDVKCLEKNRVIEKLRQVKKILEKNLNVNLFDYKVMDEAGVDSVFDDTDSTGWKKFTALFTKDTAELKFWDRYGKKILTAILPENIAKDCYTKTVCCTSSYNKIVQKIGGPKGSYVDILAKSSGISDNHILLKGENLAEIDAAIADELTKIENVNLEKDKCPTCVDEVEDTCEFTPTEPRVPTPTTTTITTTTTKCVDEDNCIPNIGGPSTEGEYDKKVHCKTSYKKECTTEKETKCTAYEEEECHVEKKKECRRLGRNYGVTGGEQTCEYISEKKCKNVPKEVCEDVEVPKCKYVPQEHCTTYNVLKGSQGSRCIGQPGFYEKQVVSFPCHSTECETQLAIFDKKGQDHGGQCTKPGDETCSWSTSQFCAEDLEGADRQKYRDACSGNIGGGTTIVILLSTGVTKVTCRSIPPNPTFHSIPPNPIGY